MNTNYIASLIALRRWYLDIRSLFLSGSMETALHMGAVEKIESAINERIKQLKKVAEKMPESIEVQKSLSDNPPERTIMIKREFAEKWPEIEDIFLSCFEEKGSAQERDDFLKITGNAISQMGKYYITVVKGLKKADSKKATEWLQGIIEKVNGSVFELLSGFQAKRR